MKKINDEKILYHEWVPITKFVPIMIILLLIIPVSIGVYSVFVEPESMIFILSLNGSLCILFLFIGFNFRGIKITITNDIILVKFGINKKRIRLNEISNCEIIKASFEQYLGFGIRVGFDSSLAYTTGFGTAIKITYQGKRQFVFSTRNQQEICDLLVNLSNNIIQI